jgi:hypothetical protein
MSETTIDGMVRLHVECKIPVVTMDGWPVERINMFFNGLAMMRRAIEGDLAPTKAGPQSLRADARSKLYRLGITRDSNPADIAALSEVTVKAQKGIGPNRLQDIKDFLTLHGLSLQP